jgi:hypothetical protein
VYLFAKDSPHTTAMLSVDELLNGASAASLVTQCTDRPFHSLGEITVPGRETATVGDLRWAVATKLQFDESVDRIALVTVPNGNAASKAAPVLLTSDEYVLGRALHVFSGDIVIVEIYPAEVDADQRSSRALQCLQSHRKKLRIYVNDPFRGESDSTATTTTTTDSDSSAQAGSRGYSTELFCSMDDTLRTVKERVAAAFSIQDLDSFHLRRSSMGVQLKDDNQTLDELSFGNESVIHVQVRVITC